MSTFDSNNTGSNDTGSAPTTARSTHTSVSSRFRIPTVVQFALTALAWGASFLFIKIGLEGLSPGQVVLARLGCGSLTLLLICAITRQAMPRDRRTWLHLFLTAIMLCVVPFLLYSWAEQHISSGLASIYNATTPLMTTMFAMIALRSEPRTLSRTIGLLLGFVGVLVVLAPWRGLAEAGLMGQLACLGAASCYGMGFIYLRRFITPLGLPALTVACGQVTLGALVMLLLTPALATGPVTLTWPVVVSMILLGAVGTGLAYVWNTNVVTHWGATNASTVTYLTPIVGVALGVLLLGERLTWSEPVGALIVILGIATSQGRLEGLVARGR